MSFRTLTSGGGPLRGDDTAVKRAFDLPECLVVFVWVVKGGGVSVVHHHSRNSACEREQKSSKKQQQAAKPQEQPNDKDGSVTSTPLGSVILSA